MSRRIGAVLSVFRSAFGNPALRRIGFAYALFVSAEFGIWIALLVFAYGHGGAGASTLIVLVQLIPFIVLAPFLGAFVDEWGGRPVCSTSDTDCRQVRWRRLPRRSASAPRLGWCSCWRRSPRSASP